jgi:phospholipid/cholesterol/gamma-HCH transport system permease protein
MKKIMELLERAGRHATGFFEDMGKLFLFQVKITILCFRKPFRLANFFKQLEFIGVQSTFIIVLTGTFTGMVFALQSSYAFRLFNAEDLVGPTVALSITRELGPVLTALMVTGRAGSAMAAELGTMRVTEQIDALYSMAVNPIQFLVVPRMLASIIMLPLLCTLFDFTGIVGSYLVGVGILKMNPNVFINRILDLVDLNDIYIGLFKSAVFGLIIALLSCYQGYYTSGGAEGVGKAATQAVVLSSVSILVSDYFLTALLF